MRWRTAPRSTRNALPAQLRLSQTLHHARGRARQHHARRDGLADKEIGDGQFERELRRGRHRGGRRGDDLELRGRHRHRFAIHLDHKLGHGERAEAGGADTAVERRSAAPWLAAVICRICPWAPGRISSWGGAARLVGHSIDSSSALNMTRRYDCSPGRTTGGSNTAVAFGTAGISICGCDTMRDMNGSRGGGVGVCACGSARRLPRSFLVPGSSSAAGAGWFPGRQRGPIARRLLPGEGA